MLKLTVVDYLIDTFFYADMYLKWNRFGYLQYGEDVIDKNTIRRRYKNGWLKIDAISMLPIPYFGDYFIMTLDMQEHSARLDKFEQYAMSRKIPKFLRERAIEGIEYKSKCFIELNMRDTFSDLPDGLHVALSDELYVVPVRFSFDYEELQDPGKSTSIAVWFGFEYLMDVLCVVDFILRKDYFTFIHRGELVTDQKAIRDYYLKQGTYLIDLFCILPIEALIPILPFSGSQSRLTCMGAITTVSYGDIAPQNAWETFAGTFVIMISIVLFVKNDVILYVKQDFIKQMRLFATCEEAFVRAVVAAFEQELYVRNDVIIAYGDRGRSLYVIENGQVLVRVPKKLVKSVGTSKPVAEEIVAPGDSAANVASLLPESAKKAAGVLLSAAGSSSAPQERPTFSGTDIEILKTRFDFFGEKSLIFDVPRSATCIALTACAMLILTLERYEDILEEFPEYRDKNMKEWIFANARENTPAAAIRKPGAMWTQRQFSKLN
ncbi:hypothetical protein P43SY_001275 [Pythium insidiosum]|uniref:Cyclic nucleotide-binding domain-containing protein n=1 Tax=Pythium insidiosum TaxID=114742 RepID=A0AAD5LXC4_PYTIN|nr:hypothetical protein P43SY_001275 [Pythium insidiosum]